MTVRLAVRAATYFFVFLCSLAWGAPLAIFIWAMATIYERGYATFETLFLIVVPGFGHVVVAPTIGFVLSLVVPPVLRNRDYNRTALASAVVALLLALLVVWLPAITAKPHVVMTPVGRVQHK